MDRKYVIYSRTCQGNFVWLKDYWWCDVCGDPFIKSEGAVVAGFVFYGGVIDTTKKISTSFIGIKSILKIIVALSRGARLRQLSPERRYYVLILLFTA